MASLFALFERRQEDRWGEVNGARWLDSFLDLIDTMVAQTREAAAHAVREKISHVRFRIADPISGEDTTRTIQSCLDACRRFFSAQRSAAEERETSYRSLIQTLTEGLRTVAVEAGSFTAQLEGASERVSALAQLDDLRALKQQLVREVGEIRRVVIEKQQRDLALQAQLTQQVAALEHSLARTQVAASLDSLTGIPNRGYFDATLQRWAEADRVSPRRFVLALVDLDNFKEINDTYGHLEGDRALVRAAQTLSRIVGPGDLVARYGGDEFALLLDDTTIEPALKRAREIVARVSESWRAGDRTSGEQSLRLTVSCGLAEWDRRDTLARLVQRADEALYEAKGQGRNCAVGMCRRQTANRRGGDPLLLDDSQEEPVAAVM